MNKKTSNLSAKDAQAKAESLKNAIAQIEKDYGKGALMRLGDKSSLEVEAQSTGALNLDMALGIGGLPKGRIVEIYGPESSGKTTITLMIAAQCQKDNGVVAFVDAEHALDPEYAKKLGVDIDELLVSQPDTGEQALEIVEALVRSNALDLIIVDSVAALVPKAEIDGEMGDAQVGLQARLMSKALRKLTAIISKTNTIVIFINQLREKVGVMFGNPETTTGGRALKFYSSVRMDIRKGESIKSGSEIIGSKTKVKVVKNKVAPPFKSAEFDIMFGQGVSTVGIVLDMAIENNLLKKSGAWISYNGEKIAQGRENGKNYLEEHPELLEQLRQQIIEIYMNGDNHSSADLSEDIDADEQADDENLDFLFDDEE